MKYLQVRLGNVPTFYLPVLPIQGGLVRIRDILNALHLTYAPCLFARKRESEVVFLDRQAYLPVATASELLMKRARYCEAECKVVDSKDVN